MSPAVAVWFVAVVSLASRLPSPTAPAAPLAFGGSAPPVGGHGGEAARSWASPAPRLGDGSPPRTLDLKLLDPVRPATATPESEDLRLERLADGSGDLIYEGPGFTALIKPDGHVVFEDKRVGIVNLGIGPLPLFWPGRLREGESVLQRAIRQVPWRPIGPRPTSSLEDVIRGAMGRRHPEPRRPHVSPRGEDARSPFYVPLSPYHADPREAHTRHHPSFLDDRAVVVRVTGTFDLTDELMRFHGQDPYRFEKAKFLAATSRLRSGLAARQRARNMAEAQRTLSSELDAIAKDTRFSPALRRSIIEDLRAEIDPGIPGGADRRSQIDTFLRERFRSDR